jgi:hypothetical protein
MKEGLAVSWNIASAISKTVQASKAGENVQVVDPLPDFGPLASRKGLGIFIVQALLSILLMIRNHGDFGEDVSMN